MAAKGKDLSFYFFDLDDNTLFLKTPLFLRNKATGELKEIGTTEFAAIRALLGLFEPWTDYEIFEGTYSHFHDIPADQLAPGQEQYLVQDIKAVIALPASAWQAPSWAMFVYACRNQRPLSIVTARGHSRATIRAGVRVLLEHGLIESEPRYLTIYPVGNPDVREELVESLADESEKESLRRSLDPTSALKRIAIRNSVERALEEYGAEPEHRFGMSDDDPHNVDLIIKAMCDCKQKYPDKRFFVIDTHAGEKVKLEVFPVDFPVTRRTDSDEQIG